MSKFLAPIHTWLFNKIMITESIEKAIYNRFSNHDIALKYDQIQKQLGEPLPDEPLENLIDQMNIHGWLQEKISIAEKRQAALVSLLPKNLYSELEVVYYERGNELARLNVIPTENPSEVFKQLGDVLLEGMPCDRVNRISEQSVDSISWVTSVCVHKENWEFSNVPVEVFYKLRSSFIKGFVKGINEKMEYIYENKNEQWHKITL